MNTEIRDYAREVLLEAKLKVIKKAMEPMEPTEESPFPSNSFHQWNEKVKKEKGYAAAVDYRFMGIVAIEALENYQPIEELH